MASLLCKTPYVSSPSPHLFNPDSNYPSVSFTHWVGIAIALIYGQLVSDRLPLAICARYGGIWKPEYRLHALWVPALFCNPIGLGIFGAGLQNHWSWGVLAFAQVLVTFGSLSITPITVNYLCECFRKNPAETGIVLNMYRVGFGLTVAFYIQPWVAAMTFAWAYGMMAILEVVSFGAVLLLMWKGHQIREWKVGGLGFSEEGEHVIEKHTDKY
jgi:MFS family permease